MERYQLSWKSHLEPDPEGTVVYYADAQATVEALQRERDEAIKDLYMLIPESGDTPVTWEEAYNDCQAALDAEREKVKGLEAKVELQETAVRHK